MSNSIMQSTKECYMCRKKAEGIGYEGELSAFGLHKHHVIFGTAQRKKSEQWGVWCWVCAEKHHEYGKEAPHQNREVAEFLMREGQKAFENMYSHELWMQEFGRNYL